MMTQNDAMILAGLSPHRDDCGLGRRGHDPHQPPAPAPPRPGRLRKAILRALARLGRAPHALGRVQRQAAPPPR